MFDQNGDRALGDRQRTNVYAGGALAYPPSRSREGFRPRAMPASHPRSCPARTANKIPAPMDDEILILT